MKPRITGERPFVSSVAAERKFAGWIDVDRPFASPGVRNTDFRGGVNSKSTPANVVISARVDLLRNQLREEYARLLVV
ncbi:hypothetical protein LOC68_23750 [Blastopirellula sp. JC732]|uniref:Uncharacterized protein n=1 Tax=Blastopirellula sediminis TaxID=2894196 RepID=A0A9X1SHM9_9BACT|nr:hypothetical protein [Blastopirellula sediminis]MCC9605280.1 hypothetical protein [Blastopirellula sediminis]MCC9631420.1 hypothetical protein [Blastopirellula sediminis]